jgi:hypothetical protein
MRTQFVCIPRPITRSEKPDGADGRVVGEWLAAADEASMLERDAGLAIRLREDIISYGGQTFTKAAR